MTVGEWIGGIIWCGALLVIVLHFEWGIRRNRREQEADEAMLEELRMKRKWQI